MCEYCKSLPKANLGLCYRGFQKFFFRPAADLPTQPPVWHSNAETPLAGLFFNPDILLMFSSPFVKSDSCMYYQFMCTLCISKGEPDRASVGTS